MLNTFPYFAVTKGFFYLFVKVIQNNSIIKAVRILFLLILAFLIKKIVLAQHTLDIIK